jgi:hypothetical protein
VTQRPSRWKDGTLVGAVIGFIVWVSTITYIAAALVEGLTGHQ